MAYSTNLPGPDRLRILAADSSSMNTQLLVDALARNAQFHVIEAPGSDADILSLVTRENPHVTLIGAKSSPAGTGTFDLIRSIRGEHPEARIVVLIDHSDPATVVEAFRSGAHGIFCRTQSLRMLTKCIECVHSGQVWASSTELHYVIEALSKPSTANFRHLGNPPLSARESDVVRCVAEGLTNRDIARRLKLTEHTVKNYLFRIFDKLGVSSRVEVVLYALGNGEARNSPPTNGRRSQLTASRKTSPPGAVATRKAES